MVIAAALFSSYDSVVNPAMEKSAIAVLQVALILIPLFMLLELGIATVRYFVSDGDRFIDFRKFFGQVLIWFFATQYIGFMNTVDGFVNTIEYSIRSNIGKDINISKSISDAGKIDDLIKDEEVESSPAEGEAEIEGKPEDDKSWWAAATDLGVKIVGAVQSIPSLVMGNIIKGLLYIVRLIVELLAYILTGSLYVLGPLAIAFNMMPFIGDGVLKNWFSTWLSIKCWVITMTVLDMMLDAVVTAMTSTIINLNVTTMADAAGGMFFGNLFVMTFAVVYLMTPFLTNLYIKGAGGQFMSMAVGGAVMLTKVAASGGKYAAMMAATSASKGVSNNKTP